jgi:hypothetical protein
MATESDELGFPFRGTRVPVTHHASLSRTIAMAAVQSDPFVTWYKRCEKPQNGKSIEIDSVEIQSVDMFGPRYVRLLSVSILCVFLLSWFTHLIEKRTILPDE